MFLKKEKKQLTGVIETLVFVRLKGKQISSGPIKEELLRL